MKKSLMLVALLASAGVLFGAASSSNEDKFVPGKAYTFGELRNALIELGAEHTGKSAPAHTAYEQTEIRSWMVPGNESPYDAARKLLNLDKK